MVVEVEVDEKDERLSARGVVFIHGYHSKNGLTGREIDHWLEGDYSALILPGVFVFFQMKL